MMNMLKALTCAAAMSAACFNAIAEPFTYQGKLEQAGAPANGNFDLRFTLFFDGGIQSGSPVELDNVAVNEGLFTVELDFGVNAFGFGSDFELDIAVRDGASSGSYTQLLPRSAINTVPIAQHVLNQEVQRNGDILSLGELTNRFLINPEVSSGMFVSLSTDMQLNVNFNGPVGMYINGVFGSSVPFYGFARENLPVGRIEMGVDAMGMIVGSTQMMILNETEAEVKINGGLQVDGPVEAAIGSSFEQISPVAFGYVSSSGASPSGTENYSVVWNASASQYEITITGEPYFFSDYTACITPVSSTPIFATTSSNSGKLVVRLYDLNGNRVQNNFSFVVYRNDP